MNWDRVKAILSAPALIIGALIALASAAAWLTGWLQTPTRLNTHIEREQGYHAKMDTLLNEIHDEQDAILRGECLENPTENLARQGLLVKCRHLGIDRRLP